MIIQTQEVVFIENMNRSIIPVDTQSKIFYYVKFDKNVTLDVENLLRDPVSKSIHLGLFLATEK